MDVKPLYDSFIEENYVPVFSQPWYLDIVCEGEWDVVVSYEKDIIVGAWPFQLGRKFGFKYIVLPLYCPALGPIQRELDSGFSTYKKLGAWYKLVNDLERKLPKFQYLSIKLYPDDKSWYPFYLKSYSQTTRYTYRIGATKSITGLRKDLKKQLRNVVTKEEHKDKIGMWYDVNTFMKMLKLTFTQNRIDKFFNPLIIEKLISIALNNNCGKLWRYTTSDNEVVGSIFIIEDEKTSYLLFTTANETGKSIEAVACLIWNAINDALDRNKSFDFEGSMITGVEKFFRGFGGEQVPYHQITKINSSLLKVMSMFRNR